MKENNDVIPYKILNYQKYHDRIKKILMNNYGENVYPVMVHDTFVYTDCGFPIEHYSVGNGDKHIVVIGGTHGCEIIGVDFVTQLMKQVALGNISNFSPDEFTIDFFPLHNPEGFIIASSAADFKLAGKSEEEIELFCHDYWAAYRQDDINSKNHSDVRMPKLHYQLFQGITVDCIPSVDERYDKLKEKVRGILGKKMGDYSIPVEALIDWRANGNGVELNGNNPVSYREEVKKIKKNNGIVFGNMRFDSIPKAIPGPLGISSLDMEHFKYEKENIFLFQYLARLNKNKHHYAVMTYHGTGGMVYYRPYDLKEQQTEKVREWKEQNNIDERFNYHDIINEVVAQGYHQETGYRYMKTPKDNSGVGNVLRSVYPAFLLIELSKMGGNPIAPYGDRKGNYEPTIQSNLKAFNTSFEQIKKVEDLYWQTFTISQDKLRSRLRKR